MKPTGISPTNRGAESTCVLPASCFSQLPEGHVKKLCRSNRAMTLFGLNSVIVGFCVATSQCSCSPRRHAEWLLQCPKPRFRKVRRSFPNSLFQSLSYTCTFSSFACRRQLPRPEGGRGSVRGKPLGTDFGPPMLNDAPPSLRVATSLTSDGTPAQVRAK